MKKILVLNASSTGTTKKLFDLMVKEKHSKDWDITTMDLNIQFPTGLTSNTIGEFYSEGTKYIDLMQNFDEVYFIASMINYGMPVALKTFIDKITLPQVTFAYNEHGKYSPMQGKWKAKFTLFYSSGSYRTMYPKNVASTPEIFLETLKFSGIEDTQYVWVDGTNMPDVSSLSVEDKYKQMKSKIEKIISY